MNSREVRVERVIDVRDKQKAVDAVEHLLDRDPRVPVSAENAVAYAAMRVDWRKKRGPKRDQRETKLRRTKEKPCTRRPAYTHR